MAKTKRPKIDIRNKKASFDYEFLETFTAGIVLSGTEIKSVREGKVSLVDSWCYFSGNELYVRNMNIAEYWWGSAFSRQEPKRDRKLLLTRKELNKLLPEGVCDLPVETLTPGQRRTVCIVRALCVPSDVRLMDEPFAGMSAEEKEKALVYIRSVIANTPLVVTCLPGGELPFGRTCPLT